MPTSTLWRRSEDPLRPRGVSPVRPSADSIERLSPEPSFGPTTLSEPSLPRHTSQENGYSLRGLGLSDVEKLESTGTNIQPDHIYYDQDGAAHVGARIVAGAATQKGRPLQDSQDWPSRNSKLPQDTRCSQFKGHTRSGSTIDDLASAAIATSPALANASPHSTTRPSTSYIPLYNYDDSSNGPPAKRIKSERLPNLEWSPCADRPRNNGYDTTTEITHEDALLLLGLKNEVNFKNNTPLLNSATIHPQPYPPSTARRPSESWTFPESPVTRLHRSPETGFVENNISQDRFKQRSQSMTNTYRSQWRTSITQHSDRLQVQKEDKAKQDTAGTEPTVGPAYSEPQQRSEPTSSTNAPPKRQRRVKPEVQAEVCAACQRLQLESTDDKDSVMFWISCDACDRWFHAECAGFQTKAEARSVDKYLCPDCEPIHGKTTYVRKSSRPRTAIDYAGLNQGVVKSSAETSTHHYIQPIKEGKFALLPDDFARIRPELLTMEFMESFEGMKRPFVVPASWNPRFGVKPPLDEPSSDLSMEETSAFPLIKSSGELAGPEPPTPSEVVEEEVIDCDQDLLDMVIPRDLTVRKIAELYGPDEPVPVIDVKSQETKGQFTLQQWADYYELQGDKPIRNVISLEVSHSPLGKLIRRPKVVRDLDLEDHVWDTDTETRTKKRPVQFYCLMSVADSYTDFHIDFGGSSVYYHIVRGTKTFFFIPPEDKYLKKYEDWCNSDSQNETWLGDLCGGNCTRVDLREGDTAFIPAGWIHSVWTPEDSLVIGGNFLTRLDYEMQIKVANIEKVTKVAPKFRYPYFQKVMWYTLIKYLEDDPLPEEVLQDFRDDPDYVFLRANPVWDEIDDLENTAEPGDPAFNARYYPKSEVAGWPPLRDFLYRTARIDAGLPVSDITKKQIEAVKASIPKGHGEPLVMIKLFAIWCAWKSGNVTAPDWVHSDGALEPEKMEKTKKPETFRLPGERSSSRKATQVLAQAEAEAETQAQAHARTPPTEVNNMIPAKQNSKPGPRANGLRVACEPCRKRRIKCRHKSGSETPTRPAPEIRPRSFSNAEPSSALTAIPNGSKAEQYPSPETRISEPVGSNFEVTQPVPANSELQSTSKKSRSKACEECRKSKRRCVHDEYGRIDPAKAAEPSKPRGSTSTKRPARLSDESAHIKKARMDIDSLDDLIDPALTNGDVSQTATEAVEEDFHTPGPFNDNENHVEVNGAYPAQNATFGEQSAKDVGVEHVPVDPALEAMAAPAPEQLTIKTEVDQVEEGNLTDAGDLDSIASKRNTTFSTPGPIRTGSSVNGDDSGGANPTPRSRHSSRQPKQVERYTPEDKRSPIKSYPKPQPNDRRASSAASAQTMATSVKSRRSSSNTSGTTHQMAGIMARRSASREVSARPVSRGSTGGESDLDADERFARELQAAENGLRRRTSVRA
ncbi:uncharacterized protein Z518_07265 [Rhinocladiella mackenziei CBS 650.93]|uniref:JmjC domain-containing histone demethylation protein 1 n=1 Tax=Rhinocladiella mackenziei CBS 650.93 TaxID=1442369 RepID=A0A0D2FNQ7_9EURO|nr:uncharacterized protein Z518_07265 [Rhinocladiella mackenziei CBS 650.93]KIX03712.1 hypothetical protein Z518_07265 [Rhinocladiella mackenziei CBS 650.93]